MATTSKTNSGAGKRRKRRSSEEIQSRLLSAAAEEFMRSGFRGATTATIARQADVTEAQLFRYFDSKADLFQEAIFKPLGKHLASFNADHLRANVEAPQLREQTRHYINDLQEFIGEHSKMFMSLLVAEAHGSEKLRGVSDIDSLQEYFELGSSSMSRRLSEDARVPPELMVRVSFVAVLACEMFKDWVFPEGIASDEAIRAAIADFVIDGLGATQKIE